MTHCERILKKLLRVEALIWSIDSADWSDTEISIAIIIVLAGRFPRWPIWNSPLRRRPYVRYISVAPQLEMFLAMGTVWATDFCCAQIGEISTAPETAWPIEMPIPKKRRKTVASTNLQSKHGERIRTAWVNAEIRCPHKHPVCFYIPATKYEFKEHCRQFVPATDILLSRRFFI